MKTTTFRFFPGKLQILLPVGLLLAAQGASLAQSTWTGNSSTSWNTAGNWSPSGVPGSNASVIVDRSSAAYILSINTSPMLTDWSSNITGNTTTIRASGNQTLNIAGVLTKTGAAALTFRSQLTTDKLTMTVGTLNLTDSVGSIVNLGTTGNELSSLNITTANVSTTGGAYTLSMIGVNNTADYTIGTLNLGTGGTVLIANGIANGEQRAINVGSLNGAGGSVRGSNNPSTGVATLNLTGISDGSYSGIIADGSAITRVVKIGSATQTFNGANTYTGSTTVTGGTLIATKATALPGYNTSGKAVIDGGTLGVQIGTGGWSTAQVDTLLDNATKTSGALGIDTTLADLTQWVAFTTGNLGSLGMAKLGINTLTLTSNNTYTGATTVSAGTLAISTTGQLGGGSYAQSIINNGTFLYNGTNSQALSGVISGNGALTKNNASSTLILTGNNTYTGATTISAGALNIQYANALGTTDGGTTVTSGAALQLQGGITVGAEALSLAGTGVSTDGALRNISGSNTYGGAITLVGATRINSDADLLTLSGGISGTQNLTIGGAGNTTISNAIATSAGTLTKDGAGTLILTGNNTYTGTTTISAGALNIQHANALGTTGGGTTVSIGAALQLQGGITIGAEALSLAGTGVSTDGALRNISGSNTYGGAITLAGATRINSDADLLTLSGGIGGNRNLTIGGAGNTTISNAIATSTGTLTKDGAGTLILTGNNTYTGATTISAGALNIQHANALGTTDGGTTVSIGAALQLQGGITIGAEALSLAGTGVSTDGALRNISGSNTYGGAITLAGATRINSDADLLTLSGGIGGNRNLTIGGAGNTTISDAIATSTGTLLKDGAGTLILTGNNTYTGATTISAGALNIQHANALGTTDGGTTVSNFAALQFQGGITIGAEALSLAGTGLSTDGALRNISGSNTYGGAITLAANTRINSDADLLTLSGVIGGNRNLTIGGAGNTTISNAIATSTGTLIKDGAGTLILTGNNTFTGVTTISAGALNIQHANALGTTDGGTTVTSGAALQLQGGITVGAEALSLRGSGVSSDGALRNISGSNTYGGAITLSAVTRINSDAGMLTLSGGITGTQSLTIGGAGNTTISNAIATSTGTLTKDGAGTLTLSGANTYTGATTISAGTLEIGAAGRLGGGSYAGAITNNAAFIYSGTNAQTLSGVISGTGDLTKNGTGTLTLSGANTYTGTTTISAGTLTLGANQTIGAIAGTGALDLSSFTLTSNSSTTTNFTGVISGTGGLTKNGAGTLTLSGANTYTGATTISAGTIKLGAAGVISDSSNMTVQKVKNAAADGVFDLAGFNETIGALTLGSTATDATNSGQTPSVINSGGAAVLTLSGTLDYNSGTAGFENGQATVSANIALASGSNVNRNFSVDDSPVAAVDLLVSGVISSDNSLQKTGFGTLRLTNANTYTRSTLIDVGVIEVTTLKDKGTASSLGTGNATDLIRMGSANTATLSYIGTGDSTNRRIQIGSGILASSTGGATLLNNGSGALTFTNSIFNSPANTGTGTDGASTARTLTLGGSNTGPNTIQGVIADNTGTETPVVNLVKQDAGTWVLSGNNTYTGSTTINAGTLQAAASGALANTSQVVLNNGGSFLVTADNAVNDSAAINLNGGRMALSGNFDETVGLLTLSANSTLDFSGFAGTLRFGGIGSWAAGANLAIWNWSGTTQYGTQVNNYANPSNLVFTNNSTLTSNLANISFYSDSGNSFVGNGFEATGFSGGGSEIIAVPEPGSYATALMLLLACLAVQSIRRRANRKLSKVQTALMP
jgi:autotransporter-associated beta strand protein